MIIRNLLAKLRSDISGTSLIEFALVLPMVTTVGMYGIELAYMSSVNMSASQLALSVADNASRMEQTNNSTVAPTVTEADITSIMKGAVSQGSGFRFKENGRIILSSLEKDSVSGKQFIHWQRCTGDLAVQSSYGNDSTRNGLNGPAITNMGQGAAKITAGTNVAVMFAEVYFDHRGIFGTMFVKPTRFRQEAAFIVRDVRDLRPSDQPGVTGTGGTSPCT